MPEKKQNRGINVIIIGELNELVSRIILSNENFFLFS